MKIIKITLLLLSFLVTQLTVRATILYNDTTNYPYVNGNIEGQGQWYCYSPKSPHLNAYVTNNVLLMQAFSTNDAVATPTNGWVNPTEFNFVSFMLNVSQLPATTNGGYFCQLQNTNDYSDACHVFIDNIGSVAPGTYRLGVGNYATSFSTGSQLPNNYPVDLSTGVWYNVVILFDTNQGAPYVGATLFVNPSYDDWLNAQSGAGSGGVGPGFAYGSDTTGNPLLLNIQPSQIGFSPFIFAGISNVIAATTFTEVNSTNLPVIGIQPQPATNYLGNPATFYCVASAVDASYQWYSQAFGKLSDGAAYTGTASQDLTVLNQTNTDTYYCIVTDAYGNQVTSQFAYDYIITTPTAPFFPTNVVAEHLTNNLFTYTGYTNTALGTGPLSYQWYFASNIISSIITNIMPNPTNMTLMVTNYTTNFTLSSFTPLSGQTYPAIVMDLLDYTFQGDYYLLVSNSVAGGSLALGPTNTLFELPPLTATMLQLHNLMVSVASQIAANAGGQVNINTNNVTISGYVSHYSGQTDGSGTTSEFYMQDASGLGIEVFFPHFGNTNVPPVGTYLTIQGPIEVFDSTLEIVANSPAAITTNAISSTNIVLAPRLFNSIFNDLSTNGLGNNGLLYGGSLVTFTNCYLYGTTNGTALGTGNSHSGVGGIFASNSFISIYFTVGGPYNLGTGHTNVMNLFQPCYWNPTSGAVIRTNQFYLKPIPTFCYQLTGIYDDFAGSGEIIPSRLADYVTNPPPVFSAGIVESKKGVPTVTWQPQVGQTYSINAATNILGPWVQAAYGLGYYPTNGTFTDTNKVPARYYFISTP